MLYVFEELFDPLVASFTVRRHNVGDEQRLLAERFSVLGVDRGEPHFHEDLVHQFLWEQTQSCTMNAKFFCKQTCIRLSFNIFNGILFLAQC